MKLKIFNNYEYTVFKNQSMTLEKHTYQAILIFKLYLIFIDNFQQLRLIQMIEIFPNNLEWNHVKFRIQTILADPSIEIIRIEKYPVEFENKYTHHMKIDCVIDVSEMDDEIDNIKYANPSRYVFQAGHIKINSGAHKKNKLLLFKIAVDHTLPIHKLGISEMKNAVDFPQNIDAIYVSESKQQLNIYPHKYKVKEKGQCCLQYEVTFIRRGIENIQKWSLNDQFCESCQTQRGNYYCPEQKEVFCGKCYEQLHRSTKKKQHNKVELNPYNSAPFCSFHHKERFLYYCLECMQLKCEQCIKSQVHRPGSKKHVEVVLLTELELSLKQKQTNFSKQIKDKTKIMIKKVEEVMDRILVNYENQKKQLQEMFCQKLTRIREQCNQKLKRGVGLHAELKRKFDEILWVENFVKFCEDFFIADDIIQMKDSYFNYLSKIAIQDYFYQMQRKLKQIA